MKDDQSEESIDTCTSEKFSAKPRAIDRPMSALKQMMRQKREEKKVDSTVDCPYKECGRKFISDEELHDHIERRHKKKAEDLRPHPKGTPIPEKTKVPKEEPKVSHEQQKILNEIMQQSKPKAKLKQKDPLDRPMTSYVPQAHRKQQAFDYGKESPTKDGKRAKPQRPQTAKVKTESLIERNDFIANKLKLLEDIEKSIDDDIMNYKVRNFAKTDTDNKDLGIEASKQMILEQSHCDKLEQVE